jgi:hypothetical protein
MTKEFKPDSRIIGAAGEHFVMCQLLRHGLIAALAPQGAPNADIILTDVDSKKLCSIQVKTRRDIGSDKGWHMKDKHEDLAAPDMFYCFVDMGNGPADEIKCYVVPSAVVSKIIKLSHHTWLNTPGARGQKRNDTVMRRMQPDYSSTLSNTKYAKEFGPGWMEKYRNRWDLLSIEATARF